MKTISDLKSFARLEKILRKKSKNLVLRVQNSTTLRRGLTIQISPQGLQNSKRSCNDGIVFFGHKRKTDPKGAKTCDFIIPVADSEPVRGPQFLIYFETDSNSYILRPLQRNWAFIKIENTLNIVNQTLISIGDSYLLINSLKNSVNDLFPTLCVKVYSEAKIGEIKYFSAQECFLKEISIGRAKDCGVQLDDNLVSMHHFTLFFTSNKGWMIVDGDLSTQRQSTNGTWMEEEFMNEDVKRVMSKLLMRMKESEETAPFQTDLSIVEKTDEKSSDAEKMPQASSESPQKNKTIKAKDFQNITLARMNGIKQKSMENLKKMLDSKQEKEVAELKKKPDINEHSKKIGKRNEPVHERVEKEIVEMKKNLETKKKKLEDERNAKLLPNLTFKPKIITPSNIKRTNEEFFKYNLEWIERKNRKTEKKKEEIEEKIKESLKFTPSIDNNSVNMVNALGVKKPIEERLLEKLEFTKKKKQAERDEQIFSFAPTIEEKSRVIAKHKIEGDVFNRLFGLSKEHTVNIKSPKFKEIRNRSFSFSNDLEDDPQKKLDLLFDLSS